MRCTVLAVAMSLLLPGSGCGQPVSQGAGSGSTSPGTGSTAAGSKLSFRGNKALSTAELTTAIAGDEEESTDLLLRTLLAAYFEAGYVLVQIRSSTSPDSGQRVFEIREGKRFRLGTIAFADPSRPGGSDEVGHRGELKRSIRARSGDWFRRSALVNSVKSLYARFRQAGYEQVNITPLTSIDQRRRVVDVTFDIQRGPRTP